MKLILSVLLFLLVVFDTNGQTIISGNVSGTWSKENSPYLVNGDLNILSYKNLIIGPGVKVIFQGHYKFDIAGQLLALGSRNDSIIFTVNDTLGFSNTALPNGSWNGINIIQETAKNVLFNCCVFEFGKGLDNDAGGAMDLKKIRGPVEILNSAFRNNMSASGGAISYYGLGSSAYKLITIKNCSFNNNYATSYGGALSISSYSGLKELSNCTFINNKAGSTGGAISIEAADKISNCLFKNNSATTAGGAVWNGASTSLKIYNSIFDHNSATVGAAYYANMGVYSGLYNCTLINNNSKHSAIYTGTSYVFEFAIVNSIVWNPGSPEVILSSASTKKTIENSIIRNAQDSTWFSATCMVVNPLLSVDKITEYAPLEGSPCIDKGNNSFLNPAILVDFKNNCRIWDGKNTNSKTVDIGAIEYNSVDSFPVIKNNLSDVVICEGAELSLVVSTYDEKDQFQWFQNYNDLNHSLAAYSINISDLSNSGYYFCRIHNKYGEIQSEIAKVIVQPLPEQPLKPNGTIVTITNLTDTSFYKIPKIIPGGTIQWELSPSESGDLTFNDTLAVVHWNKTFQGVASLVVKHSNENCYSLSDTLQLIVERDPNFVQKTDLFAPAIYPNPSSGKFYIDLSGCGQKNIDLIITDNLGRILKKESFQNIKPIKEYKLPRGMYFVIITTDNKQVSTNKLVVN